MSESNDAESFYREVDIFLQKYDLEDESIEPIEDCRSLLETIGQTLRVLNSQREPASLRILERVVNLYEECRSFLDGVVQPADVRRLETELYGLIEAEPEVKNAYDIAQELELVPIISSMLKKLDEQQQSRLLSPEEISQKRDLERMLKTKKEYLLYHVNWIDTLDAY